MKFRFIHSLSEINAKQWDDLRQGSYPFLSHAFLSALEESGSVGTNTGWSPQHLVGEDDGKLLLAMPLYLKTHSYGEYVFDWQWAQAFEHHGRQYYPKLLSAVPFTPASGPRVLTHTELDNQTLSNAFDFIKAFTIKHSISSWHLLFPNENLAALLNAEKEMMLRQDVQFHWKNNDYANFDAFLGALRSTKRKQIRRERRKVAEQDIKLIQKSGADLSNEDWQDFYRAYCATYYKRSGHAGYLNKAFFEQIANTMSDQIMLVLAYQHDEFLASSLFFFDDHSLYGRYWGALEEADCLHFEACYYPGIDFAIDRGLQTFNPGTQGEHKLVRGFEPVKTNSYHWIADSEFATAISHYLARERASINDYQQAAADYLPFKSS